jgi:hypothetical protein
MGYFTSVSLVSLRQDPLSRAALPQLVETILVISLLSFGRHASGDTRPRPVR